MAFVQEELKGVVPPLLTPLTEEGTLDEECLISLVHYTIQQGVHGLFTLGTTGEGSLVTKSISRRVNEIVLREVADRVPVYCGAIESSTSRTIETIKELEQVGVEIAFATPYYFMDNSYQSEVIRHFEQICRATKIKVMIYGHTKNTGISLQTHTIMQLAQIDNIVAIKDTRPDWNVHLKNIIALKDLPISIFGGGEEVFVSGLISGAHGNVSSIINVFPKLFVDIYVATNNGDIAHAFELQKKLLYIKEEIGELTWLSGLKYVAKQLKLIKSDRVSSPVEPLATKDRLRIDQMLEQVQNI